MAAVEDGPDGGSGDEGGSSSASLSSELQDEQPRHQDGPPAAGHGEESAAEHENPFGIPYDDAHAMEEADAGAPPMPPPLADPDVAVGPPAAESEAAGDGDSQSDARSSVAGPAGPGLLGGTAVLLPVDDPAGMAKVGRLRVTDLMDRRQIYACCPNPAHGSCIKTKTCLRGSRPGQGRPLGYLGAWILAGMNFENKRDHMKYQPSLEERRAARRTLAVVPMSDEPFDFEAALEEGEASEPEVFR